ncbi:MAG: hypothetical protein JWL94_1505 [Microbacteriaceae bacterium]|nr:hypothetical protein [Microbacteriaceae bacterium]HEV7956894.1 hypothetical protein [Marisediminicola sp.]
MSADVVLGAEVRAVWYHLPGTRRISRASATDAFFVLALIPAMAHGTDLEMRARVSPRLLQSADTIQDLLTAWYPVELSRVRVRVARRRTRILSRRPRGRVLSAFTGGVDSFYTLMKQRSSITHLLFVHGFDIPLSETSFRDVVGSRLSDVADAHGKKLIQVETNLKELMDSVVDWGLVGHGAALASVALLLGDEFSTFHIPSTHSYAELGPRGSHVVLDHLWSTENLRVIHDGAEATRIGKVQTLIREATVLNSLRVCWRSFDEYNCSKCSKCLRTMVSLEILDALDSCSTFKAPLDLAAVARSELQIPSDATFARESLAVAVNRPGKEAIAEALRESLRAYDERAGQAR